MDYSRSLYEPPSRNIHPLAQSDCSYALLRAFSLEAAIGHAEEVMLPDPTRPNVQAKCLLRTALETFLPGCALLLKEVRRAVQPTRQRTRK